MKSRVLYPLLWMANIVDFLSRPQSGARLVLIRVVGAVVAFLGIFLSMDAAEEMALPILSVGAALLGLVATYVGLVMVFRDE